MDERHLSIAGVTNLDKKMEDDGRVYQGHLLDTALAIMKVVKSKWNPLDMVFKEYSDGITNRLMGCRLDMDGHENDAYLLRMYGEGTDKIIDRDVEKVIMVVLNQAGCAKPLWCQFLNGIVYGFIPGSCLNADTVRNDHKSRLVAEEMVKVGAIEPMDYKGHFACKAKEILQAIAEPKPCLFPKMRKFLDSAPEAFSDEKKNEQYKTTIPSLSDLAKEMDDLEAHLSILGSPIVFSHNDLLLNNIVYNEREDRCYFIDYEYAGFNYQAYDIANHFCEWAGVDVVDYALYPDKPTQLNWLKHFLKAYKTKLGHEDTDPSEKELETLYVQVNKFALAAHLSWGVWALVQARYSAIDFDFLGYSKIRLDEYFKKKEEYFALELPQ